MYVPNKASDFRAVAGDARRQPRCTLTLDVLIKVTRNGKPTMLAGRSLEVTTVGMSVTCEGELFPGEVVMISLGCLRTGLTLNLRAMVLNRKHARYGFKFFRLTCDERQELRKMIMAA